MTKFFNYLNENIKVLDKTDAAIRAIEKHCQPFLKDLIKANEINISSPSKFKFMYSGRKSRKTIFSKPIRKNRKPMDTSKELQDIIDDMLFKQFGWRPRSSSLFCTSARVTAESYGTVYLIFPVGKYKILWSPSIVDLWSKYFDPDSYENRNFILYLTNPQEFENEIRNDLEEYELLDYEFELEVERKLDEYHDRYEELKNSYKEGDLRGALESRNEILLNSERYIAVNPRLTMDIINALLFPLLRHDRTSNKTWSSGSSWSYKTIDIKK